MEREKLFDRLKRLKLKTPGQSAERPSNTRSENRKETAVEAFVPESQALSSQENYLEATGGRSQSAPQVQHSHTHSLVQHDKQGNGANHRGIRDPLGLHPVWLPDMPIVDIIFIHGLGGYSMRSWSWGHNPNNFWPAWLSSEPELSEARVHTFGYSAGIVGATNTMNILDFAKDLLFKMKYAFTQGVVIGSVPIIFVTHSMGGLVAKKAYTAGKNGKEYKGMIDNVQAIVFLSTPHRGGNGAKFLSQVLQLFNMSKDYLKELSSNSIFLQNINDEFNNMCDGLKLFSFYETMKTSIGGSQSYIIDKNSGMLNLQNETSAPMAADHHTICKFPTRDDHRYRDLRNILISIAHTFQDERARGVSVSLAGEHDSLGSILEVDESDITEDVRRARILMKPGTCTWINEKRWFQEWWQNHEGQPQVLWLSGAPAAGKSVLATYIVESLRRQLGDHSCQYHALSFSDKNKRSAAYLLRSLAYQIARGFPLFRTRIVQLSEQFGIPLGKMSAITLWEKLFRGALFNMPLEKSIYWVIDGLDESDSIGTIFQCLKTFNAHSRIKILLVSRPTSDITMHIKQLPYECSIQRIATSDTYDDVRSYVTDAVGSLIPPEVASRQRIVDKVLSKSSGNFLWVSLAVSALGRSWHRESTIDHALSGFAEEMTPMYARMIQKVEEQESQTRKLASVILTWATFSLRPLLVAELKVALQSDFPDLTSLEDTIPHICGDFVQVRNSKIVLVHETAKHFLMHHNSGNSLGIKPSSSHGYIATICLQHLISTRDRPWRQLLNTVELRHTRENLHRDSSILAETFPFLAYAARAWAYHLSFATPDFQSLRDLLHRFFKSDALTWVNFLALVNDLKALVQSAQYLKKFTQIREKTIPGKAPESFKAEDIEFLHLWATDLIKLVGKFGNVLVQNPSSIHKLIPPFCPANSIVRRTFGQGHSTFSVNGISFVEWDDCHARLPIGTDHTAAKVVATMEIFAALVPQAHSLVVWHAETCEELHRIRHDEYLTEVAVNKKGDFICTSGIRTIKVWELSSGREAGQVDKHSDDRIIALSFGASDEEILVGYQDHLIVRQNWVSKELLGAFRAVVQGDPAARNGLGVVSFSPDCTQVAVASRNRPVELWDLESQSRTNRCVTKDEKANVGSDNFLAAEVIQWHPHLGNIFILYHNTAMVDWNPTYDEQTEHAIGAKSIICSPCGRFLLTSNHDGSVNVFTLPGYTHDEVPTFRLLYHLECHELVRDLAFSPDGQRFYDLRGSVCSVWEPDALAQPDEDDEHEDRSSITGSLWSAKRSEAFSFSQPQITAIASSPTDFGFCCGRDDGSLAIHDMSTGNKIRTLPGHSPGMAIIALSWSSSGNFIASGDDSGYVLVRRVLVPAPASTKLTVYKPSRFRITDGIHQLLFSSDERYLLISNSSDTTVWDISSKAICHVRQTTTSQRSKWIEHPKDSQCLLSIASGVVHVRKWNDFLDVISPEGLCFARTRSFSAFERSKATAQSPNSPDSINIGDMSTSTNDSDIDFVECAAKTKDRRCIMLGCLPHAGWAQGRRKRRRIEIIRTADIDSAISEGRNILPVSVHGLAGEVARVLGSYNNHVVFFNHQYWLCTWDADRDGAAYKRHLFLPKDWINSETLGLTVLTDQGTLLCPRNGEVAVIKHGIKL